MRAVYSVIVAGQNISATLNPILESIRVSDKAGTTSDTASIVLDDADGMIVMPSKGDPIQIMLGWEEQGIALVFSGTVDEVRGSGTRGGGRTLTISAKGFDTKGKAKEPLEFHKDDASLQEFMQQAAQKAGLSGIKVSGALASIKRDYWFAATESFIHLGQRIAEEVGGTFKIVGNIAVLSEMGSGLSVSGLALGSTSAVWGQNLLQYDIAPTIARPRFSEARVRWYDKKAAKYKEETLGIQFPGLAPQAQHTHRSSRADADEAKGSGKSNSKRSKREAGSGTVTIVGTTAPQPEGMLVVAGCRPGIDGGYKIDGVEQNYERGGGWTTKVSLKEPQDGGEGGSTPGADGR